MPSAPKGAWAAGSGTPAGGGARRASRAVGAILHDQARRYGHGPLDLPLDYRSPWWAAVGDQVRAAGGRSFSLQSPLNEPPSLIDVAYCTFRTWRDVRVKPTFVLIVLQNPQNADL